MNTLTHEQAIQFLHEVAQHLSVDQQAELAAHLAACDQCRAYADQLATLQPRLIHALHARRYAHPAASGEPVRAILQHKRRSFMRKQSIAILGTIVVAAFAILAVSLTRTPSQSWAGAPLTATFTPTVVPTAVSILPTPTMVSQPQGAGAPADKQIEFKLPWVAGIKHCVTQNHRVQSNGAGLDFDLEFETILAPQDGTVTYADWNSEGGGSTVIISHTSGATSTYMHLSQIIVKSGVQVKQGQPIGVTGDTGDTPGPLLHFHILENGRAPDPVFSEVGHALQEGDCVTSQNVPPVAIDRFEPNDNFEQATLIDANVKYDQLNFAMLTPNVDGWDSDYFKVQVKPGISITCRTLDLSAGTDTNLILYDKDRNGIAGNDDVNPVSGYKNSSVTYTVTAEGWLYVLVGEGFSRSPTAAQQATYSLECSTGATTPLFASGPVEFPKIDRHPAVADWGHGDLQKLPTYDPNSDGTWQVDLRTYNLSQLDLRNSLNDLLYASFDSLTKWPAADKMPPDFDWQRIMELGKNPGLGIRQLHAQGITGKRIGIAIIDQTLLVDHQEYKDQLRLYEEGSDIQDGWLDAQMHGPGVASIAVGKNVGVAPEADLYYLATGMCSTGTYESVDFACLAQGVRRILEINQQLPNDRKIRVLSMSIGWWAESKGYQEITAAVQDAKDAGMLVVSSSLEETFGYKFNAMGRAPLAEPDQFESYEPGLFWAKNFYTNTAMLGSDHLLVPMDSRTTASPGGPNEYAFYREGGWSWSIPYIAGIYALAAQVKPSITPDEFWSLALKTGQTIQLEHGDESIPFGPILDPAALIESLHTK